MFFQEIRPAFRMPARSSGFTAVAAMRLLSVIALALVATTTAPVAQSASALDMNDARGAIEKLATLLEENFIYPEIGKAYAGMLRGKLASGAYARFGSAEELAAAVTRDLHAVHPDGHLRLQPPSAGSSQGPSAAASEIRGVGKAGWLATGVAYMSLHGFTGPGPELTKLQTVLDDFSSAKTLIIDSRPYLGGWVRETDIMFSYFFGKPTIMVEMETRLAVEQRGGSPLVEGPTLKRVAGPEGIVRRAQLTVPIEKETGLKTARIFLLTSKQTASGGEHFSLAMKRTGRATLIGETTAGAGHFGGTRPLGGGYRAFIPVGRTFDPDTNLGWEGTGITPHVEVPADQALDEALRRAQVDPSVARKALEARP